MYACGFFPVVVVVLLVLYKCYDYTDTMVVNQFTYSIVIISSSFIRKYKTIQWIIRIVVVLHLMEKNVCFCYVYGLGFFLDANQYTLAHHLVFKGSAVLFKVHR